MFMTEKALGAAVTRLERAIARLERTREPAGDSAATQALAARHERLRARVRETVARLDALIAAGEGAA